MLAILLTACASQVAVIPEATATLTPLPTETSIPTATLTPAPVISPEIKDAQEFFGEGFEITADGKVIDKKTETEILGFTIVPFNEQTMIAPHGKEVTWGWQRVYEFEGKTDFTVVGTENDITITDTGGFDMYAWGYENGQFTRQKVKFAAPNNGTVELEGFSPQEVQEMIINNSSEDPKYRINSSEELRKLTFDIPKIANGQIGYIVNYKGMSEKIDRAVEKRYGNTFIPVANPDGTWSNIDTALFMVYPRFTDRNKALVVWMDKNDKPVIVVMEGKYLDLPQYFNSYWRTRDIEDPFTP